MNELDPLGVRGLDLLSLRWYLDTFLCLVGWMRSPSCDGSGERY